MRIKYVPKKFRQAALEVITQANQICADYQAQGYDLTLRQLYYQFVARGLIQNKQSEYDRLGGIINDARLAGLLDWDYIVDRTRNLRDLSHWDEPTDLLDAAARQFRTDKWANQPTRIEVWIEKDALVGVLEAVCPGLDVPYFSCRGYTSQSEIWGAAQRLNEYLWAGQNVVILHLGDHDPSGIDMSRDIEDRLRLFTSRDLVREMTRKLNRWEREGTYNSKDAESKKAALSRLDEFEDQAGALEIRRIALNLTQVEEYNPPPNFAKLTDSRVQGYIDQFGDDVMDDDGEAQSWELDALDPATLSALITEEVEGERDDDAWDEAEEAEQTSRDLLRGVSDRWDDVVALLEEES